MQSFTSPLSLSPPRTRVNALSGLVLILLIGVGCSASAKDSDTETVQGARCRDHSDCQPDATCESIADVPAHSLSPQWVSVGGAPGTLPGNPACQVDCLDDAECPTGQICGHDVGNCGSNCILGCKHQDCTAGSLCQDGSCLPVTPCTSPEFAGCPAFWTCDPATDVPQPVDRDTILLNATDEALRAVVAGCRQLTCDEPGGAPCPTNWRCDETLHQCNPISCDELGLCPSGADFVCRERNKDESVDAYGCVVATCEEGFACQPDEVCDVATTHPTTRGCRFQTCDEGFACATGQICSVGQIGADAHGCTLPRCDQGGSCQPNAECQPTSPTADSVGCVTVTLDGSCESDSNCTPPQVCVLGQCHDELGECR